MSDSDKPSWVFDLNVFGPILIQSRFTLDEVESFFYDHVFFQSIDIKSASYGAQCSLKVHAETGLQANLVAQYVLEQVLHVLALQTNLTLILSRQESRPFAKNTSQHKRVMEKMEWQQAFRETHHLLHREPTYLLALGEYRQALGEENPVQRFKSLFRSIEYVARHATRNHLSPQSDPLVALQHCFHIVWEERERWPYFRQDEGMLEDIIDLYVKVTGGVVPVVPGLLTRIIDRLEVLHRAAHTFLVSWRNQQIALPGAYIHTDIHLETGWSNILQ